MSVSGVPCRTHPHAEFLPAMSAEEYQSLAADIAANGLRVPIARDGRDGSIVDGRHRSRACKELGIEPAYEDLAFASDEEVLRYVVSLNLNRRHLNESQRALVAARVANHREGRARITTPNGAVTQKQAAELLNVSHHAVQRAKVVLEHGAPELIAAVDGGKVPITVAEKVARFPQAQQRGFVFSASERTSPPNQILAGMVRDERREAVLASAISLPPLPGLASRYPILVADPPWMYPAPMGHSDRSTANHYPTMGLADICDLPVADIATPDATLYLWVTVPMAEAAFCVVKAWGWRYVSQFCWVKGKQGMGYHARNRHELVYICRRGSLPLQEPTDTFDSILTGAPREGVHSAKPDELLERIESMYPDMPKIELFSRAARPGWASWGLESGGER
jgi:N6-adenosine-specific RNA methylase IME4